ncbi:unnamed protein product [Onchocerca ochengi]|uniref:Transposase n=1 Tax=Onchocerca ochengi TaxID=42157 RepID=A0A182DWR1_ONCOC|nr:unnamed protein product [Onchocerca ochengi]
MCWTYEHALVPDDWPQGSLMRYLKGCSNPQRTNLDSEMANLKNQPDKCAIAKRRKENKKAKEAKNSYVVESKDG